MEKATKNFLPIVVQYFTQLCKKVKGDLSKKY